MSLLGDFSNIDNTLTGDTNLQSLTVSDFTCDFINGLDGTKLANLTSSTSDLQTQINSIVAGGITPNISVGTTSTLVAGSAATVVKTGTQLNPILSFGIPAGVAGVAGTNGTNGVNGVSPTLSVGTVSTLAAGSVATVVQSGTALAPIYSFGIPQGANGANGANGAKGDKGDTGDKGGTGDKGDKGDTGGDGGGALAGAAAGSISGGISGTASGSIAGSSAGAEAGSLAASTAYEGRVSTLETQSTYFLKSAFPPTETCSAILRVKDTAGISTVHNFDQSGLYTFTGGLSLSSGSFTVNSTGDLTSNSITTTNIKSSANLNLNFSNPLGGTQINIGKNTGGISPNYINIGSLVDTIYINGLPYVPFNINTSFVNQVL